LARLIGLCFVGVYLLRSKRLSLGLPQRWLAPLCLAKVRDLLRVGLPISIQISIEFAAIAVCALLMGQFGSVALAANQIAFTCAATTFMVPLGLSMALTIRVGHAIGAQKSHTCRRIIYGSVLMVLVAMVVSASSFILFGSEIACLFTNDPEVITLAVLFLGVAGIYQIFDGVQVTIMGALRALLDVRVPTLINVLSFFVISIPLGAVLAFYLEVGPIGLWIGLATGFCISAFILSARLWHELKRL
jgi:MATE family multidrug resistance protein